MAEVGAAYVSILPSAKGFGSKLSSELGGPSTRAGRDAGAKAGKAFHSGIARPLRLVGSALAGVFAVRAVGGFLKGAIDEATEAAKVGAQTAAVLKSTRGEAGLTRKQIENLAGSLSALAGVDDEVIQQGENVLLTFTSIRNEAGKGNDVFNQATAIALDMSKALGTDLQGSIIQVGKALNDPIKGITALQRVGVSFTAQQREQIATLVKSGKTLEAQKVILAELRKEFGGTAAAVATPAEKMQVAWGNLKEQIGAALLPTMNRFITWLSSRALPAVSAFIDALTGNDPVAPLAGSLKTASEAGATFRDVLGEIGDKAGAAWKAAKPLLSFVGNHPKLFAEIAKDALLFAAALKAIGAVKGLGGKLGVPGVSKAAPLPVFVTNPGFAGVGKTPPVVGVPGGKAPTGFFGKITASSLAANVVVMADVVLVPKAVNSLRRVFNMSFDLSVNESVERFVSELDSSDLGPTLRKHAQAVYDAQVVAIQTGNTGPLQAALRAAYADAFTVAGRSANAATRKTIKDLARNYSDGGKQSGKAFSTNLRDILGGNVLPAAKVPVVADVSNLLAGGLPALPGVKLPVTADTRKVPPQIGALVRRISRDLPNPTITPTVQPKNALSRIAQVADALDHLGKSKPTPKPDLNSSNALMKIRGLQATLTTLHKTRPTPKVSLNDTAARARIAWLDRQFVLIGHAKPTARATVDTGNALARINKLLAALRTLDKTTAQPKVGVQVSYIGRDLPGKAHGGPVYAGQSYMVGEVGPEVFVPRTSGTIIPNNQLGQAPTTSGGTALTIENFNVTSAPGERAEKSVVRSLRTRLWELGVA